jgi:hypothetical protein
MQSRRNTETLITISIWNKEDVAENMEIDFLFRPSFKVQPMKGYSIAKQSNESDYPEYISALFRTNLIHVDVILEYRIRIKTPDETKLYDTPVYIFERKTGITKCKLAIETTD